MRACLNRTCINIQKPHSERDEHQKVLNPQLQCLVHGDLNPKIVCLDNPNHEVTTVITPRFKVIKLLRPANSCVLPLPSLGMEIL